MIVEQSNGILKMSNEKTRRGLKVYKESPFMNTIPVKSKRITNKRGDMMIVSRDDGEIVSEVSGFWERKEVDSSQFIKLYVAGVRQFAELTNAGTRVFALLYDEMQKNIGKDKVYLSFSDLDTEITKISQATFTRGMRELIDKKFLAPCPAIGWYWLNPDFIFNGDRLTFYKEYWKKPDKPKRYVDTRTGNLFDHYQNQQQAIAQALYPAQAPAEPPSPAVSVPAQDEVS
jgi:hypothetical protein